MTSFNPLVESSNLATSVDNNAKGASNHNGCFKVIPATQTSHFGKIHRPNLAESGPAAPKEKPPRRMALVTILVTRVLYCRQPL